MFLIHCYISVLLMISKFTPLEIMLDSFKILKLFAPFFNILGITFPSSNVFSNLRFSAIVYSQNESVFCSLPPFFSSRTYNFLYDDLLRRQQEKDKQLRVLLAIDGCYIEVKNVS